MISDILTWEHVIYFLLGYYVVLAAYNSWRWRKTLNDWSETIDDWGESIETTKRLIDENERLEAENMLLRLKHDFGADEINVLRDMNGRVIAVHMNSSGQKVYQA